MERIEILKELRKLAENSDEFSIALMEFYKEDQKGDGIATAATLGYIASQLMLNAALNP